MRRVQLLLATILILAAALRFDGLGGRDVWVDEAASWIFARAMVEEGPGALVDLLRHDSGPPLYYALLGPWTSLLGDSPARLRLLSALAGLACVAVLFLAGRRFGGREQPNLGLAAALLAALSPIAVYFGQQARYYALLALASLVVMLAIRRWLDDGHRRDLALFALALTATLYLHNATLFLLPALAGLLVLHRAPPRRRQLAGGALAAAVVAWLPWLPVLRDQMSGGLSPWMRLVWEDGGAFGVLASSGASFAPGGAQPRFVALAPGAFPSLATILAAALLIAGLVACVRDLRRDAPARDAVLWLLLYATVPPLAALAISWLREPIYLPARLDQLVLPAWCLLAARGAWLPRRRAVTGVLLVAFAALALQTHLAQDRTKAIAGEHVMAARIAEALEPGDAVVATSLTYGPLAYELRHNTDVELRPYPPELAEHPGHLDLDILLADPEARRREAATLLTEITNAPNWSGRLVLAFVPDKVNQILLAEVTAALPPQTRRDSVIGDFELSRVVQPVRVFLLATQLGSRSPRHFDPGNAPED